jgi:hypothetical protein
LNCECLSLADILQYAEVQRETIATDFISDFPKREVYTLLNCLAPSPGSPPEVEDAYEGLFLAFDARNNKKPGVNRIFYGKAAQTPVGFLLGCQEWWDKELQDKQRKIKQDQKQGIVSPKWLPY